MLCTRQLITNYSRCEIFRFQVHHYYTGTPFRLKTLSSSEIRELAQERNIVTGSSFQERNEVMKAIETEISEGKLSVKNAVELMSFQDLQNNLKMRNVSTLGAGKQLRQKLHEILKQEESVRNKLILQKILIKSKRVKKPLFQIQWKIYHI